MKKPNNKSDVFVISKDGIPEFIQVHAATKKFCEQINQRIRSEYGVIEEIIQHQPSIGNYYEKIMENIIREYLPSMWKLGTGFVFDDRKNESSPQIDILIYDDQKIAPIFRCGDLVVVRPNEARFAIEVKKKLRVNDLRDVVSKFIFSNTGDQPGENKGIQYINVFAYESSVKVDRAYEYVCRIIEDNLKKLKIDIKGKAKVGYKSIETITLPRLFFLESHRYIDCHINFTDHVGKITISLNEIPYTTGGASDLISRILFSNSKEWAERSYLTTVNVYLPVKEHMIEFPIIIREFISIRSAMERYPSIKGVAEWKTEKLKNMVGFLVPKDLMAKDLGEFFYSMKSNIVRPLFNATENSDN